MMPRIRGIDLRRCGLGASLPRRLSVLAFRFRSGEFAAARHGCAAAGGEEAAVQTDSYWRGRITRRRALGSGAAGLSALALAACGGSNNKNNATKTSSA